MDLCCGYLYILSVLRCYSRNEVQKPKFLHFSLNLTDYASFRFHFHSFPDQSSTFAKILLGYNIPSTMRKISSIVTYIRTDEFRERVIYSFHIGHPIPESSLLFEFLFHAFLLFAILLRTQLRINRNRKRYKQAKYTLLWNKIFPWVRDIRACDASQFCVSEGLLLCRPLEIWHLRNAISVARSTVGSRDRTSYLRVGNQRT